MYCKLSYIKILWVWEHEIKKPGLFILKKGENKTISNTTFYGVKII